MAVIASKNKEAIFIKPLTVVCHNERSKNIPGLEGKHIASCGRYLTQVEDVEKDSVQIPYCKECRQFVRVEVKSGKIYLQNIDKSAMDFSKRARVIVKNFSMRGG
jgi:hypothetical protein